MDDLESAIEFVETIEAGRRAEAKRMAEMEAEVEARVNGV